MANVVVNGVSMYDLTPLDIDDPSIQRINVTSSGFQLVNSSRSTIVTLTGVNLTYHQTEGYLTGGTTTGLSWVLNGVELLKFESAGVDASYKAYDNGYAGLIGMNADVAYALRGDDVITGLASSNYLKGFEGNDTFYGNGGGDTFNGGVGTDTVAYSDARANYIFKSQGADFSVTKGDIADTLIGIENVKFSDGTYTLQELLDSSFENTTANFLQARFNITMLQANEWVIAHLNAPSEIYATCHFAGITADMLADIVQPSFTDITITGRLVNDWLLSHGTQALI